MLLPIYSLKDSRPRGLWRGPEDRSEEGKELPWDGEASGDVLVRGPWIISSYFKNEGGDPLQTDEKGRGWFPTGDVAKMSPDGYMIITDRSKDGRSIQGAGIDPDFEVAPVRLSDKDVAELKTRAARFTEASLPHALQNEQGAERKPPHVPADMPPADYKGEDYQLDQAVALLRAGKATPGASNAMAATPAPVTP